MPAPLDPAKRDAIEQAIRDGGTCGGIAREHGVSRSTVSKIGKELEAETGSPAFERSQTKRAGADRAVDLAERRQRLALRTMERAEWLIELLDQELPTLTRDGDIVMVQPCPKDMQHLMTSYAIAVDKVDTLTRDDSEGLAAVDAWLKSLTGM